MIPPKPLITRLRYKLETLIVYAVYYFFKMLPLNTASNLGGAIMRAFGPSLGPNRTARKNLVLAFPDKTEEEREVILKGMWDNLGRVAAEYSHLDKVWANVELIGAEHLEEVRNSGEPAIFYSAHLANWEVAPISAIKHGIDMNLVYRKPNNQGVESLLRKARSFASSDVIPKGPAGAKKIVTTLRAGKAVGVLMDQKLNEGLPIPFFGHDAMTAPAMASFALKMECAMYPTRVERLDGAKMRITIYPKMKIIPTDNKDADIKDILTRINNTIEEWVRERPEQWLWIHHRWPKQTV